MHVQNALDCIIILTCYCHFTLELHLHITCWIDLIQFHASVIRCSLIYIRCVWINMESSSRKYLDRTRRITSLFYCTDTNSVDFYSTFNTTCAVQTTENNNEKQKQNLKEVKFTRHFLKTTRNKDILAHSGIKLPFIYHLIPIFTIYTKATIH